jgi:hypothetical protein
MLEKTKEQASKDRILSVPNWLVLKSANESFEINKSKSKSKSSDNIGI